MKIIPRELSNVGEGEDVFIAFSEDGKVKNNPKNLPKEFKQITPGEFMEALAKKVCGF